MKHRTADDLRRAFLDFFGGRDHRVVASASLVPENDPTLLFTGAGMNQFKDLFLGRGQKPFSRAASCQKCFRTGDLEQVGRTTYHHTFFEMLGNFSFGDYFKEEAILWAWEFLTGECGLPPARLSATVYTDDDEAYGIWRDRIGLPPERITRLGAKSNFWPSNAPEAGPNGVCGPCSEIFFDYGAQYSCGPSCRKEDCDCRRYTEVWNLVFTQFNRVGPHALEPLPQRNIDTGMGFERLVAVVNGHLSTFDTPLFMPIIGRLSGLAAVPYEFESEAGVHMRRIADHVRAAVFCLVDGVKPGRDGRDFVLRRVIRRAARDGIYLGIERPFLADLVPVVAEVMGAAYPAVAAGQTEAGRLIALEEERFRSTYAAGMAMLDEAIGTVRSAGGTVLPGDVAFRLHDERGFPADVTEDVLAEKGLSLDRAGFEAAMEERRRESRSGSFAAEDIFARGPLAEVRAEHGPTVFTGYERTDEEAVVLALVRDDRRIDSAAEGEEVVLVTDRTPFYAEAGGQVGDAGEAIAEAGRVTVTETRSAEGVTAMSGRVVAGAVRRGDRVVLRVDVDRRDAIRRNHTATHLLHKALRANLGASVTQAGSLVAPDRLRFDFHHDGPVAPEMLRVIEWEVNRAILANFPVSTEEMTFENARQTGAMALFGEKYGGTVRVVSVADYSKELCGGTHCRRTGDIGSLRIVTEANVGSGLRRIEAVTGLAAVEHNLRDRELLRSLSAALKARPEDLPDRLEALREENRELRRRVDQALAATRAEGPEETRETLANGVDLVLVRFAGPYEMKHLLSGADRIREKGGAAVALLAGEADGGVAVVVTATAPVVKAGFDAGQSVREVAKVLGGGGGGRPELGQGKGREIRSLGKALDVLRARVAVVALS